MVDGPAGQIERCKAAYRKRFDILKRWHDDPRFLRYSRTYYKDHPAEFIDTWISTMDPRNAERSLPTVLPFVMYPRQRQMVDFVRQCLQEEAEGAVEKSREVGATWICAAFSVWLWLFRGNISIGWGSLKAEYVDSGANPSSIFEKIRIAIRNLPPILRPRAYETPHMRIINHDNGSIMVGECGDNIGRSGRNLIYFVDEAAHLQRPEKVEASLSANARVRILVSSVHSDGHVFQSKCETGQPWSPDAPLAKDRANVFEFDWSDNPLMTQEEYDNKRAAYKRQGLLHVFKQEYDRDPLGSTSDQIINPEWFDAAIDAHKKFPELATGKYMAALDVADEGGDFSALSLRKGLTLRRLEDWDLNAQETARVTIRKLKPYLPAKPSAINTLQCQYDSVGVGSNVKNEVQRLHDDGLLPEGMEFVAWNAGAGVLEPDAHVVPGDRNSPTNQDHYANLKAQAVWSVRNRFEKTYLVIQHGEEYPADELISISSKVPRELRARLRKELAQYRRKSTALLKEGIDKHGGQRSPDLADSVVQLYFPAQRLSAYARAMLNPNTFL